MAYELVWARSRMNRNRTLYGSSLGGGTGFMIENLEEDDAAVPTKPVFTEPTPPANAAHVRSMALFFTRRVAGRSAPPRRAKAGTRPDSAYLPPPTVTPSTKARWNERKISTTGRMTSAEAAISRFTCTSYRDCDWKKVSPIDSVYLVASCR
jgi:hypothetical protein